jgi:hypothetical protein
MVSKVQRTVIDLGGSRVIALPKPWIDGMMISPGDKLEILFDQDCIVKVIPKKDAK